MTELKKCPYCGGTSHNVYQGLATKNMVCGVPLWIPTDFHAKQGTPHGDMESAGSSRPAERVVAMQLQLRKSPNSGFCILVVRRSGGVIRCHALPDETQIDELLSLGLRLDRPYWLDAPVCQETQEQHGELVAKRTEYSAEILSPRLTQ